MTKLAQLRGHKGLLHKLCQLGHLHLIKQLTKFPDLMDFSQRFEGITPLMAAFLYNQPRIVKHLMTVQTVFSGQLSEVHGSVLHLCLKSNDMITAIRLCQREPSLAQS